ncbi:MAG: invasion associated locus B family protein [Rhodobacter sp.]|nr:invasion associated locus B family protein [Rhodobacter sp.]
MTHLTKTLPFLLMLAMATPSLAQTTTEADAAPADTTAADTTAAEATDPLALSMGKEDVAVGGVYIDSEHGDWQLRCIKAAEGNYDPCQMYQLLDDGNGNPVAEINIFPLPGGEGKPAAGATIITPLETLLTQQLGLSVDGSAVKKYPFSWCSTVGCFSRIGFSEGEVAAFKRGNNAAVIIVPVAAADQKISLKISLSGFTAGFKAATDHAQAGAEAKTE